MRTGGIPKFQETSIGHLLGSSHPRDPQIIVDLYQLYLSIPGFSSIRSVVYALLTFWVKDGKSSRLLAGDEALSKDGNSISNPPFDLKSILMVPRGSFHPFSILENYHMKNQWIDHHTP